MYSAASSATKHTRGVEVLDVFVSNFAISSDYMFSSQQTETGLAFLHPRKSAHPLLPLSVRSPMIECLLIHLLPALLCLLAMGWYPCCGAGECDHCSDRVPRELSVEISGLTNSNCLDCDDLNGTFTLGYVGQNIGQCRWEFDGDFCVWDRLVCILYVDFGDYFLEVAYQDSTGASAVNIIWLENLGTYMPDCEAWDNQDVSVTNQPQGHCQDDYSTCTVTAL